MARIRTIKPEFFRHEGLQDMEAGYPGLKPMLVFAGLWTIADKNGVFEWRPRQIKLDILPFLEFDIAESLQALASCGFIKPFSVNDRDYGYIQTFQEHQRISGKEAQAPGRYPDPPKELTGKQKRSTGEATGKHPESQEREREKERERDVYSGEFLSFWSYYPKKSGSKKAAFNEWKKLNGQRPDLDSITTAIQRQIDWRLNNPNGEFRPEWKDPERWLKGRMWEAETDTPPKKAKSVW